MITLTLPENTGLWSESQGFTDQLPEDLSNTEVFVEAAHSEVSTQSFADGLVFQTLDQRKARRLVISNPTMKFAQQVVRSSDARQLGDKLIFRMTG